jgi:hypothetical protein
LTGGLVGGAGTPPAEPETPASYSLTIYAGTGGTTTPATGVYNYVEGTELSLTATAASGYQFRYWKKSDDTYLTDNPIDYTVTADETLTPIYQAIPPVTPPPTQNAPGAVNFGSLWDHLLYSVEKQGADCTVTLHALQLGYEQAVNGQYIKQYVDSTIKMVITDVNSNITETGTGRHSQIKTKAYCKINVCHDDEVTDSFGNTWVVESSIPYNMGNILAYYQLHLSLKPDGNGAVHPPASGKKHLAFRVLDGDDAVFNMVSFSIRVIDLEPDMPITAFPYKFPMYFTS